MYGLHFGNVDTKNVRCSTVKSYAPSGAFLFLVFSHFLPDILFCFRYTLGQKQSAGQMSTRALSEGY